MITRIVKLHFQADRVEEFLRYFDTINTVVSTFSGCQGMKLYQDVHDPNSIMTYSHWQDLEALEAYRNSDTFESIWTQIKPWFAARPEAWSVKAYFDGFATKNEGNKSSQKVVKA